MATNAIPMRLKNPLPANITGNRIEVATTKGLVTAPAVDGNGFRVNPTKDGLVAATLPRWAVVRFGLWHLVHKN